MCTLNTSTPKLTFIDASTSNRDHLKEHKLPREETFGERKERERRGCERGKGPTALPLELTLNLMVPQATPPLLGRAPTLTSTVTLQPCWRHRPHQPGLLLLQSPTSRHLSLSSLLPLRTLPWSPPRKSLCVTPQSSLGTPPPFLPPSPLFNEGAGPAGSLMLCHSL